MPLRRDGVLIIIKLGYERWKPPKNTGRRWIAETVFSSLKRVLDLAETGQQIIVLFWAEKQNSDVTKL